MWISVVPTRLPSHDLLLPAGVAPLPEQGSVILRYGSYAIEVKPCPADEGGSGGGMSIDQPAPLAMDERLVAGLRLRTEPVYQLLTGPGCIEIGPVVGLLLGNRNHWYDADYLSREPQRVTGVYPRTGGLFCAFSPRNVSDIDGCAYGLFYDPGRKTWRYSPLPIPSVLHRRSFQTEADDVKRLRHKYGARVFNSFRFDKWQVYAITRNDAELRPHLPETVGLLNLVNVVNMIDRHRRVVLKPTNLSRGRGIIFIAANGTQYAIIDYRTSGKAHTRIVSRADLVLFLIQFAGRSYLCQQYIDLATIGGAPFDIRVVMQRDITRDWQCTGIECRLAARGESLTNIAAGGRALLLPDAVSGAFGGSLDGEVVRRNVVALANRLCRAMDGTGETFGEFGIDMALDCNGALWFIEANVVPTFKGFQAIDPATYHALLANPLLYAVRSAGFAVDTDDGGTKLEG